MNFPGFFHWFCDQLLQSTGNLLWTNHIKCFPPLRCPCVSAKSDQWSPTIFFLGVHAMPLPYPGASDQIWVHLTWTFVHPCISPQTLPRRTVARACDTLKFTVSDTTTLQSSQIISTLRHIPTFPNYFPQSGVVLPMISIYKSHIKTQENQRKS